MIKKAFVYVMASAMMMFVASCGSDKENDDEPELVENIIWEEDNYNRVVLEDGNSYVVVPASGGDYTFVCKSGNPWLYNAKYISDYEAKLFHVGYSKIVVYGGESKTVPIDAAALDSLQNKVLEVFTIKSSEPNPCYEFNEDGFKVNCEEKVVSVSVPSFEGRRTFSIGVMSGEKMGTQYFVQNPNK